MDETIEIYSLFITMCDEHPEITADTFREKFKELIPIATDVQKEKAAELATHLDIIGWLVDREHIRQPVFRYNGSCVLSYSVLNLKYKYYVDASTKALAVLPEKFNVEKSEEVATVTLKPCYGELYSPLMHHLLYLDGDIKLYVNTGRGIRVFELI